jgi:hypothetical protein
MFRLRRGGFVSYLFGIMAATKNQILLSGVLLISLAFSGCTSKEETPKPAKTVSEATTSSAEPRVSAANGLETAAQVPGGVVVSSADVPVGGGYLVVYADGNGAPGARLGASSLLRSGVQKTPVTVKIPSTTGSVWIVLHRNGDGNETLDFPGADAPMNDPVTGGAMVEQIAELAK